VYRRVFAWLSMKQSRQVTLYFMYIQETVMSLRYYQNSYSSYTTFSQQRVINVRGRLYGQRVTSTSRCSKSIRSRRKPVRSSKSIIYSLRGYMKYVFYANFGKFLSKWIRVLQIKGHNVNVSVSNSYTYQVTTITSCWMPP